MTYAILAKYMPGWNQRASNPVILVSQRSQIGTSPKIGCGRVVVAALVQSKNQRHPTFAGFLLFIVLRVRAAYSDLRDVVNFELLHEGCTDAEPDSGQGPEPFADRFFRSFDHDVHSGYEFFTFRVDHDDSIVVDDRDVGWNLGNIRGLEKVESNWVSHYILHQFGDIW